AADVNTPKPMAAAANAAMRNDRRELPTRPPAPFSPAVRRPRIVNRRQRGPAASALPRAAAPVQLFQRIAAGDLRGTVCAGGSPVDLVIRRLGDAAANPGVEANH